MNNKYIKNITFVLTYNCNSKCKHCDIWNNWMTDVIKYDKFVDILNDKILNDSYTYYWSNFDIAFSWWEVFTMNKFIDYFNYAYKKFPNARYSITTNWLLTDEILDFISYLKDKKITFKLNISLDWPEKIHNLQRWLNNAFSKTIKTIILIKKKFPNLLIELKFTITKINYEYINFFIKFSHKLWVFFSFKPYEYIGNYINKKTYINTSFNKEQINIIEEQIIDNKFIELQKDYKSPYFFYKIPSYLRNWLTKEERSLCTIAQNDIMVLPNLQVHTCILMDFIWDLNNNSLEKIWSTNNLFLEKQREKIKKWRCTWCMLMCWWAKTKEIYLCS